MSRDPINTALDVDFSAASVSPVGDYLGLWAAVLRCAIVDLSIEVLKRVKPDGSDKPRRLPFERALEFEEWRWVMSPNNGLGSFVGVCVVLDLDPDAVRLALKKRFFK